MTHATTEYGGKSKQRADNEKKVVKTMFKGKFQDDEKNDQIQAIPILVCIDSI